MSETDLSINYTATRAVQEAVIQAVRGLSRVHDIANTLINDPDFAEIVNDIVRDSQKDFIADLKNPRSGLRKYLGREIKEELGVLVKRSVYRSFDEINQEFFSHAD